jgi:N-acetylglucosamine kinase-like BadF-type ATPase
MSTLIIDAGSTKMEWVVLERGKKVNRLITRGFNPNYAKIIDFINILYKELPEDFPAVDAVFYYGSGCGNEAARAEMQQILKVRFEEAKEVEVGTDMLGAARALLGREKGIACILGTGANSCVYDGDAISENAISLGYLVGDEGSGCYIGRKLVRAYFYDLMPLELKLEFEKVYKLNIKDFIDRVYHQPEASKYLAGFTEFAGEHQSHPFIQQLVKSCFKEFIDAFVLRYPDCRNYRVCFVGSVAFYFQYLLHDCLSAEGLTMGKVMRSPMDGLIQLYS